MIDLRLGDCLELMRTLDADSVDAVVTDPPAGIAFMGKDWDNPEHFPLRDRGELPGGHTPQQTPHKHGRGFANGMTFDKSRKGRDAFIDFLTVRLAECYRVAKPGARMLCWALPRTSHWTGTAVEDAGWRIEDRVSHLFGTGFPKHASKLKPAAEDWWLAIKPAGRAVGLNIDDCRIGTGNDKGIWPVTGRSEISGSLSGPLRRLPTDTTSGRWPANVALTCCGSDPHDDDCAVAMLDRQSGTLKTPATYRRNVVGHSSPMPMDRCNGTIDQRDIVIGYGDSGGASRFFYTSKASRADRGPDNTHPTVKSAALMDWLIRLITQPGDVVLDPFAGSGSTGKAAVRSGRSFIGFERDPGYFAIARRRIEAEAATTAAIGA